jgi:hypothetical protein
VENDAKKTPDLPRATLGATANMENLKPGTLSADGIVFDYALPMGGDGEYRIPPRVEEPDIDLEPDEVQGAAEDDAPEDGAPVMDSRTFFAHLNRLRR